MRSKLLLSDGTTDYIYGVNGTPIEQETVRPAITFVGDTTATGLTGTTMLTVNLPSGTQANAQVFVDTSQSAGTTVSAPSTYTLVASVATGGTAPKGGSSVFRHTVIAGDTSVTLTYGGTASVKAVVLAAYRGADPTLPVDVFATSQLAGSTTVVAPSVKPLYTNERLVVFQGARGTFSSSAWTSPSGMTEEAQANAANVSAGLADQTLTAAGATGNSDIDVRRECEPDHGDRGHPAAGQRALLPDRPAEQHASAHGQRWRCSRRFQLRRIWKRHRIHGLVLIAPRLDWSLSRS